MRVPEHSGAEDKFLTKTPHAVNAQDAKHHAPLRRISQFTIKSAWLQTERLIFGDRRQRRNPRLGQEDPTLLNPTEVTPSETKWSLFLSPDTKICP